MVAGVSYWDALDSIPEFRERLGQGLGTTWTELKASLATYGIRTSRGPLALWQVDDPKSHDAIVVCNLRTTGTRAGDWHWCVWDASEQKLIDPSTYKWHRWFSVLRVYR